MEKCAEILTTPREKADNEQYEDKKQKWMDLLQTAELSESDYDSDGDGDNEKMVEEMITNINQISEESAQRRTSIEKDFKDIQTRLDTNKNNLDKIKTQIEKVTDVLHKLKDNNASNGKLQMGDWSQEVEAEMSNEKLLEEYNREMGDLENALAEDLKDLNVRH